MGVRARIRALIYFPVVGGKPDGENCLMPPEGTARAGCHLDYMYVLALVVWAPIGALPVLVQAIGLSRQRAQWVDALSSASLVLPMSHAAVRDRMAPIRYHYYAWLVAAGLALVVTLASITSVHGRLANAVTSWLSSIDGYTAARLVNIACASISKMYLALLVYADCAIAFVAHMWRHDGADEEDVQRLRAAECAEMAACLEEDRLRASGLSLRDVTLVDGASESRAA